MAPADGPDETYELQTLVVHGHRVAYRLAGTGPALLLLHGLGCDSTTWLPVLPRLARRYTVIVPDLLGHGQSDKPRGDYSLGGYANGMRDLLAVLGINKVTVVGHSFGGGIAMQFAYQFPERTERMVLVAPGGLGPEVSGLIRALTLPGAGAALGALTLRPLRPVVRTSLTVLARSRLPRTRDLSEVACVYRNLSDPAARSAIRHVISHIVDWRGQVVTVADRAYLARLIPMCLVWGNADKFIPVSHAQTAESYAPGAQVHVLPGTGHFPHKEHPERFSDVVDAFVRSTEPASFHRAQWRALLRRGDVAAQVPA